MANPIKAIPDGYHTITPHLIVRGAAQALDFYRKAFGAEEFFRMPGPDGKSVVHAEIKIGDSMLMLCDECPTMNCRGPQSFGGTPVGLYLYVQDVDQFVRRAVDAGAKSHTPVQDMFWGDRLGKVIDPFGHEWTIATHTRDLTPEQIAEGAKKAFASSCTNKATG